MKDTPDRPASAHLLALAIFVAAVVLVVALLSASAARAGGSARASTAGTISSDTTWTQAITITSPITVTSGATLTIGPGVEVRFYPDTWLRIEGRLEAQGTHAQQIRMTAARLGPTTRPWQGLIAAQPSADVRLQSVTIANAIVALRIERPDAAPGGGHPQIEVVDSLFESNDTGIAVDYSGAGATTPLTLRDNLLTGNGVGLRVLGAPGRLNKLKLNHNSFAGNGVGLKVDGPGRLKARQQWWGSAGGPRVGDARMCDPAPVAGAGDLVCGPVDFAPWSRRPDGRMLLAAQAGGVLESAVGPAALNGDESMPGSTATLTVPAGTFDQPIDLLMSGHLPGDMPPAQPGLRPTQLFLEISASAGGREVHTFAGAAPLQLTIEYTPEDLAGADPSQVSAYYWDEALGAWSSAGLTTTHDPEHGRITVVLEHLSRVGVMLRGPGGGPSRVLLPLVRR